jgi:S-adenosylmethionine decarboxylase
MSYQPGLHILSEFTSIHTPFLTKSAPSKQLFTDLINEHGLQVVGEIYHDFEGGGFTGVICLTESHLSIHTWPEYNLATFDIFLSNYKKDNSHKVRAIHDTVVAFFEGQVQQKTEIIR